MNQSFNPISGGGRNITAFVFDSGINASLAEFEGRAKYGTSTVPFLSGVTEHDTDVIGQGTFTAALIGGKTYGVARNISIVSVQTIGPDGNGLASTTLKGIVWAVEHWNTTLKNAPSVFHFSIGAPRLASFDTVINAIRSLGIGVVAAAGNDIDDACLYSPSSALGSIAVATTDKQDRVANFSNTGPCVAMFAPGVEVESVFANGTIGFLDGTSFSAPLVTGALALNQPSVGRCIRQTRATGNHGHCQGFKYLLKNSQSFSLCRQSMNLSDWSETSVVA
jgi:subtilisin family serine protease